MSTRTDGSRRTISAVTATPSGSGICRSRTTTCGRAAGNRASAPRPSAATATTSRPAAARSRSTASRHSGWSPRRPSPGSGRAHRSRSCGDPGQVDGPRDDELPLGPERPRDQLRGAAEVGDRPRIDSLTPSRPCAAASSGRRRSPCRRARTARPGPGRPGAAPTRARPHPRAAGRCRGRPGPRLRASGRCRGRRATRGPRGATVCRRSSPASSETRSTVPARRSVSTASWARINPRRALALLLPGQPAELGSLAAQLAPSALDQCEHLEHAVVHGPRETRSLGGDGRRPFGGVAIGRHLLQRLAHEPDDRSPDHQQERVAVVGLADVLTLGEVGSGQQEPGDESADPPVVDDHATARP